MENTFMEADQSLLRNLYQQVHTQGSLLKCKLQPRGWKDSGKNREMQKRDGSGERDRILNSVLNMSDLRSFGTASLNCQGDHW